ncbi:MAG: hypothetical protein H6Q43_614 [Deltaproteobacteria bacterium]|nr:hypothetical protein [Deltaproteobacteria bacterium]
MISTRTLNSSVGWPRKKMKHRNLSFFARDPLPGFPTETAVGEKPPKPPDIAFLNFPETYGGDGGKDFASPDFVGLPDDVKGSKKSPSGDSAWEGKRIEAKGTWR